MKIIIQRVKRASLEAHGEQISNIGPGLFVLVGITHDDTQVDIDYLIPKLLKLKLWAKGDNGW